MVNTLSFRFDIKSYAHVRGLQGDDPDRGRTFPVGGDQICFAGTDSDNICFRMLCRVFNSLIQNICDIRMRLLKVPDLRVIVVPVGMGTEDVQLFVRRDLRQTALVPVKKQGAVLQRYQETAVVNVCDFHFAGYPLL